MPQIATPGVEDTEPVDLYPHVPTPWYQRSPTAVVAGGLGIFLLAAIVFAVVTVSNDSTHAPGTVQGTATSLTPVPPVTTSSTPTALATPPPTDTPEPVPPTVTETASTEDATTEAPVPGWPGGGRWRHLFPHLHLGGQ